MKFSLLIGIITTSLTVVADVGDGTCEKRLNNEENNWDGGDCTEFNEEYPGCKARDPWRVGDGYCNNWGGHNSKKCKKDGGDCIVDGYPKCDVPKPDWIGDGVCQSTHMNYGKKSQYNSKECGWDGGDCFVPGTYPNCPVELPRDARKVGDGHCDTDLYIKKCGFDEKDCDPFYNRFPDCKTDRARSVGNGECDVNNNNTGCEWDGGDCLSAPNGCADSPFKAQIEKNDGSIIWRDCSWVKRKKGRCNFAGISSHCPEACDECDDELDSTATFKFWDTWYPKWGIDDCVGYKSSFNCRAPGMRQTCPIACFPWGK